MQRRRLDACLPPVRTPRSPRALPFPSATHLQPVPVPLSLSDGPCLPAPVDAMHPSAAVGPAPTGRACVTLLVCRQITQRLSERQACHSWHHAVLVGQVGSCVAGVGAPAERVASELRGGTLVHGHEMADELDVVRGEGGGGLGDASLSHGPEV
jgi:hypothetical protein